MGHALGDVQSDGVRRAIGLQGSIKTALDELTERCVASEQRETLLQHSEATLRTQVLDIVGAALEYQNEHGGVISPEALAMLSDNPNDTCGEGDSSDMAKKLRFAANRLCHLEEAMRNIRRVAFNWTVWKPIA